MDRKLTPETLREQHGGTHYKCMPIQPAEYNQKNELKWCEGEIVKLISRHHLKNGAEDVRKAIHYCKMVLELEYGESYEPNRVDRETAVEKVPLPE